MNIFMGSPRHHRPSFSHSRQQSGATLIIVLILLILITLFGMASVRSSLLQERMVSGTISNNLGFQAAEAGLRQAEVELAKAEPKFPDAPNTCNEKGFCSKYVPTGSQNDIPPWAAADFWKSANAKNGNEIESGRFKIRPKYVIEDFGKGETGSNTATDRGTAFEPPPAAPPKLYRITSYAQAPGTDAETILQSIYIR